VTEIVRGDDLVDSTPRQILLYRALGLGARLPNYCHLPLVIGEDGRRLAKRHGDTRLAFYRQQGASASRLLALLAKWCGMGEDVQAKSAAELIKDFDLNKLPREAIVFTQADDRWLRDRQCESQPRRGGSE
jgi:glutamyl-tRNA synthetase